MDIQSKLKDVHSRWESVAVIIDDYQVAVERGLELEIRISQLQKENDEMKDQCDEKDRRIEDLNAKINSAHEDLRVELRNTKAERDLHKKNLDALEETRQSLSEDLKISVHKADQLDLENRTLKHELEGARTATNLASAEMLAAQSELGEVRKKLAAVEADNKLLTNKIRDDTQKLIDRMEEVNKLEEEAIARLREADILRDAAEADRGRLGGFFRNGFRKNPFARRLANHAQDIEKGQMAKAVAGIEMLLVEMKANMRSQNDHSASFGDFEARVDVLDDDDSLDPRPSCDLVVPVMFHETEVVHQHGCTCCASSLKGDRVATAGSDMVIRIWDSMNRSVRSVIEGRTNVRDVSFTCDGTKVLVAGADKTVCVYSASTGANTHTMTGHSGSVNCLSCHPDLQYRAVSTGDDRFIRLWDLNRGFQIQESEINLREWTNALCFSQLGNLVISGHSKGRLRLWDVRQPSSSARAEARDELKVHDDEIVALCPSPNNSEQVVTAGRDNKLTVYDFRSEEAVCTFTDPQFYIGTVMYNGKGKCSIGVSEGGRFVCAGSVSGCVMVWEADGSDQNKPTKLVSPIQQEAVVSSCWAYERIFSCHKSGKVVIWH